MPPDFDDVDSAVLLRFVSGDSPPAEAERVRRWAATAPGHATELDRLQRAWAVTGAEPPPVGSTKAVWRRITSELPSTPARELRLISPPAAPARRWALILLPVAAAAMVAVIVGISHRRAPMREVATKRGERDQLRLSDGTRIVLGPATTLRIRGRDVYLDGEGYFDVAHDTAHPFTVHTAHALARALGTRFSVRAYDDDRAVEVVVDDGVVGLGAARSEVRLQPGDVGSIDTDGLPRVVHVTSVTTALDWTRGVIHFDDVALGDAIKPLERQYDLVIHIASRSLASRRFTATFTDQNLSEVLSGLAFLIDARVHRDGRVVTLTRKED